VEISLKKARKIETTINTFLEENDFKLEATVRVLGTLDEAKDSVANTKSEIFSSLKLREELLKIRFDMRRQIEKSNEESGINALINKKVLNEKTILELDKLINHNKVFDEKELDDVLKSQSKIDYDKYSFRVKTTFEFPVFQKEDLASFKDKKISIKKDIEKIEDELSFLNLNTKIILSEDVTKLLEFNKIL
jgi:hypothetical protein